MGHPDLLGKVQPGYYADVILIDGNPVEDIEVFQDTSKLHAIVINGHVHKNVAVVGADGQSLTADGLANKRTMYTNLPLVPKEEQERQQRDAKENGIGIEPQAV
jgi:cytosine/adenosine deaminase-related metal-dependent hydrolase